jgi:hypothetical protein
MVHYYRPRSTSDKYQLRRSILKLFVADIQGNKKPRLLADFVMLHLCEFDRWTEASAVFEAIA